MKRIYAAHGLGDMDMDSPAKAQSEVERLARIVWEELNVPHGRNWDDHAVSAARSYWRDRVEVILAALPSEEQIRADERKRCIKAAEKHPSFDGEGIIATIRALGPREQDKPT